MPNLTPDSVLAELQPIFQEALDNPALAVTRSSSASDTPSWDSVAHIEIIEMVERHFKVRFDLGELQDLKTVGDLVDLTIRKAQR
ncbi:MAG TPA: acyl carrier protein [Bryobacteraceae bacterium]|nr:acyl carrier protein [Bryobacteraceae bacterium]